MKTARGTSWYEANNEAEMYIQETRPQRPNKSDEQLERERAQRQINQIERDKRLGNLYTLFIDLNHNGQNDLISELHKQVEMSRNWKIVKSLFAKLSKFEQDVFLNSH